MSPCAVVAIHVLIQIQLQGLQVRVDLFPESDPVEFIQNGLMNPLTDPVRLWALRLGLRMLDLIELQIELIGMFIRSPTELGPAVCSYP